MLIKRRMGPYRGILGFLLALTLLLPVTASARPDAPVRGPIGTDTTLQASTSAALVGQPVTLTAVVWSTADNRAASGTVTFRDGTTPLATASLDPNGTASYTTSWTGAASHSLTAAYAGNATLAPSTSVAFALAVDPADAHVVKQNVVDLLGRFATTGDLSAWTPIYDTSGDAQVALAIEASSEAITNNLKQIYATFMHGPIPASTKQSFASQIARGTSYEAIEAMLAGSTEYFAVRGGNTNTGFLTALFNDVLQRPPTGSELSNWNGQIDAGVRRQAIAADVIASTEGLGLRVNSWYERYLRRPATSAELAQWVPTLQDGAQTDQRVISQLIGGPEYATFAAKQPLGVGALPLGALTITSASATGCVLGDCEAFTVTCPGLQQPATGLLDVAAATAAPNRGVVLFFSGSYGTTFWGSTPDATTMLNTLRGLGYTVVQVEWTDSWLVSASGEAVGAARLACRPATVTKWVHDTIYAPLGLSPAPGQSGFCMTGNSGGASQVSYLLSYYDLDALVNAAFPTGGPAHAALATGCLPVGSGGDPNYRFSSVQAQLIDSSEGYRGSRRGPCASGTVSFAPQWQFASADTNGFRYDHPSVRVGMMLGGQDVKGGPNTSGTAAPHARDFQARLLAATTPRLSLQVVPTMSHEITDSPDGLDALQALIAA